ncbi:hypothetical protein, no similarity [Maudiozyma saulgeensis]|uniref:Uncharacterized protein n=1 Tax=Maudiozyma saulgeensis TaxID=1789683 RepID=A0A1X7R8U8_9SACH|nr:hypothetical protein, no similarity [Kazachstania saulgeensis]
MTPHYKIRLKPELQYRRKYDSSRYYYQYNIKDRINRIPLRNEFQLKIHQTENLPFHRMLSALRQYYIFQQIIYYARQLNHIQKIINILKSILEIISKSRLYLLIRPIINFIDTVGSMFIQYPLKFSPTCRTVSIREVKKTTLLPMIILLQPMNRLSKIIRQNQIRNFPLQKYPVNSHQQRVILSPIIHTALLITTFFSFVLSMFCLYASLILYWVITPRNDSKNIISSNEQTVAYMPDQHITHDSFMTFSTPKKFVSIKWSCEISIHSNNLPTFNLYPKYRLKPSRTYVQV